MSGKKLVSTRQSQGWRKNDFCWVPDGEEVTLSTRPTRETTDGPDGSARSLAGIACHKSTTTAIVVPDEDPDGMAARIRQHYLLGGFNERLVSDMVGSAGFAWITGHNLKMFMRNYPTLTSLSRRLAEMVQRDIADINPGMVVEYRENKISPRPHGHA